MATVPGSRPGAGGKIVTNRRRQRLSATPYDRPPPPPPPPPPPTKSPNWLTGVIIPSARALASGAGKFLASAIFSESEPSSEDEDLSSGAHSSFFYVFFLIAFLCSLSIGVKCLFSVCTRVFELSCVSEVLMQLLFSAPPSSYSHIRSKCSDNRVCFFTFFFWLYEMK